MARSVLVGAATIAVGAVGIVAYALLRPAPSPTPEDDLQRDVALPPSPTSAPNGRAGSAPQARRFAERPGTRIDDTIPPGPKLGNSQDPGRAENAQAIFEGSVQELERLPADQIDKAQRIFLHATAALERIDDELADDDELGHVELRRQTDTLRDSMLRFAPR